MFIDGEYQPRGLCSWDALIAPIMGLFSSGAAAALPEIGAEIGLTTAPLIGDVAAGAATGGGLMPFLSALGTAGNAISGVSKGVQGIESMVNTPSPASSTGGGSPSQPNITPAEYTAQQDAYYKQMLAGLGMGTEGNQLPQGIQDAISKQAALL